MPHSQINIETSAPQIRYPYRTKAQNRYVTFREVLKWLVRGFPDRLPDILKRKEVFKYAQKYGLEIFVESGTYLGDMVQASLPYCEKAYSIEIQTPLWQAAVSRFRNIPKVKILCGNGPDVLPAILDEIHEPALFWLDGHFASGTTHSGEVACPTLQELILILHHPYDHVVLIDDAREFTGKFGYPTVEEVSDTVKAVRPQWEVVVHKDIIRIAAQAQSH